MRLAHLSDLHLLDLTGVRFWQFFNQRVAGGVNLLLGRRGAHDLTVAGKLVEDLNEQGVDHVVVTGDVSNLSFSSELRRGRSLLAPLGDARRLSLVPGNHDRYTYAAERRGEFEEVFAPWLVSDLDVAADDGAVYPWVKLLGPLALVGLCSSVATPLLFSGGRIGPSQLRRLEAVLEHPELSERQVVVCLHHPLLNVPYERLHFLRGIADVDALRSVLVRSRAALVLYGHNHRVQLLEIEREGRDALAVHGATSATLVHGPSERRASYAIYSVDGEGVRLSQRRRWHAEGGWQDEEA